MHFFIFNFQWLVLGFWTSTFAAGGYWTYYWYADHWSALKDEQDEDFVELGNQGDPQTQDFGAR